MLATHLRLDDMPQPLGVDHDRPAFSWIPESNKRNAAQHAYRILVASSRELLDQDTGDIWDTGRVTSNQTREIYFSGKPLAAFTPYWWKIQLWDGAEQSGGWSAQAHFAVGPLSESDWQADWIGRGPTKEPRLDFNKINGSKSAEELYGKIPVENESALLRHEFQLDKPVKRATAFVCGLGFYHMRLNGERIGEYAQTPAKTDYRELVLFDALDVTASLKQGANAVCLVLGNGWYNPGKQWWDWHMQWHGSKRAILHLRVTHTDGSETVVTSNPSWKTTLGPIREHCIYNGELYDARLEQPGWDKPGFDDASWAAVNIVEAPGGELRLQTIEPISITETIRPKRMWEISPGVFVFDMGQNFSGIARITVQGREGSEIQLRHAETVHPDGTLNFTTNGNAMNLDRYILKGAGKEIYTPSFTYHGFRYLEARGFPDTPTLDSVTACVLHTASPQTGEFTCSHDLVNHIHRCVVWSQRSNMMGLPTDDNQRAERLGWMADGHLAAEQFMHNFEPIRFYKKWLRDMKHAQNPENGSIPYIVPRPFREKDLKSAAWSSAYPLVTWYLYIFTGETGVLEEHFESICRYVDFLSAHAENHILPRDRYGDHLSVADNHERGEPLLSSTWYFYYDAMLAARMAEILENKKASEKYSALADAIRNALNNTYYDEKRSVFGTGNHCEQIMPLMLQIEPQGERGKILDKLLRNILDNNDGHIHAGILGAKYFIDLMMKENRNDALWKWVTREKYPSFAYMTKGHTTLSETWQRTGTNNHVMWGHIDTWFYQGLAGIRPHPDKPGYRRITIQPYFPEALDWVRAAVHTPRGRVASAWTRDGETMRLDVTIPANTTAEISIPSEHLRDNCIFENNTLVWNNGLCENQTDIHEASLVDGYVTLRVGSGQYRFLCEWQSLAADKQAATQSPWLKPCHTGWQLSRLHKPGNVDTAPCVKLADKLEWRPVTGAPFINVHEHTGMENGIAYVGKRVSAPQDGVWILDIGHDGGIRIFVDNKPVAVNPQCVNPAPAARTSAILDLAEGEHEIMIAFDTANGKGWGFYATWDIPTHARKNIRVPVYPLDI